MLTQLLTRTQTHKFPPQHANLDHYLDYFEGRADVGHVVERYQVRVDECKCIITPDKITNFTGQNVPVVT